MTKQQVLLKLAHLHKVRADDCGALARVVIDVLTVPPMQWPKARDLFLRDDMGQGQLRVLLDSDNDVCVAIWPEGATSAAVEFCNGGGGGGKSPNTRVALIALMCAMEKDGASESPRS